MTFEQWYSQEIIRGQAWCEDESYKQTFIYKQLKKAYDAGVTYGTMPK